MKNEKNEVILKETEELENSSTEEVFYPLDKKQAKKERKERNKRKKEKKSTIFWVLIGIGCAFIILLILLNAILSLGDRIAKINVYASYVFYVVVVIALYFLIIRPVVLILLSPSFKISTVLEDKGKKNYRLYKKISKNLISGSILTDTEKEYLSKNMKNYDHLRIALSTLYNSSIKREINKIIRKHATTIMVSTAMCPNAKVDFFTSFTVNLKLIKEIVLACGFRPNYKNLGKLCFKVMTTAFVAEGLENVDLTDVLPNSVNKTIDSLPFVKPVLSGVTQGITNAMLTIRIGVVTRKYLFKEGNEITSNSIRKAALKETIKLLPLVITDGFSFFPKKWFKNKENLEEEEAA